MDAKPLSVQYLKNRKTCCRSGCLHCPYGYTIKEFPPVFQSLSHESDVSAEKKKEVMEKWNQIYPEQTNIADSLLNSAFGPRDRVKLPPMNELEEITLKDVWCGFLQKSRYQNHKIHLHPDFQEQNIENAILSLYLEKQGIHEK